MLSRISQLRQTISDELENAAQPRPANDAVSVIERNREFLNAPSTNVDDIIADLEDINDSSDLVEQTEQNVTRNGIKTNGDSVKKDVSARTEIAEKSVVSGKANKEPREPTEPTTPTKPTDPTGSTKESLSEPTKSDPTKAVSVNAEHAKAEIKQEPVREESKDESAKDESESTKPIEPSKEFTQTETIKVDQVNVEPAKEPVKEPVEPIKELSNSSGSGRSISPETPTRSIEDPTLAAKLAKLTRYEEKYPQLLKAYKTEKKRGELVKLYESVLGGHTPCASIAEPQVLVDFIKSLAAKAEVLQREQQSTKSELEAQIKLAENYSISLQKKTEASQSDAATHRVTTARLRSELQTAQKELTTVKYELELAKKEVEELKKQVVEANADKVENGKVNELQSRLEVLEAQLDATEQSRDAAQRSQTTLKTQLDELSTRLTETRADADVAREELVEVERRAQERLTELSTLLDSERQRERSTLKSATLVTQQLEAATAERDQLEAEVAQLNKRIVRESDHLQVQLTSLKSQLRESEAHENELRKQLAQKTEKQKVSKSQEVREVPREVVQEPLDTKKWAEAQATIASTVKANELLKQVNADSALRIERLQRTQKALTVDCDTLRHENEQLKKRTVGTVVSNEEKQTAYLKNVLLGFVEHKGQRAVLLPVLSTLLGLSREETEKLNAL